MSPFDLLFKKKKRKSLLGRRQGEQGVLDDGARLLKEIISSCDGRGCYPIQMFSVKEIEEAIKEPCTIGAYACYFCGAIYQGRPIFIKIYNRREDAFNEIVVLAQIRHTNVVKLMGCCFDMERPILIFEYVPYCLSDLLWEANPSSPISWENRLRIAIEIAYAITYLHIGTTRLIVHRHIKCSHILLDEHYKPKLCDFSLSITVPIGETHVEMDRIEGTMGYIDPEYMSTNLVSEKTDVYSYGVVLLGLLSGKKMRELERVSFQKQKENIAQNHPFLDFIQKEITDKEKRHEWIMGNGLSMNDREVDQATACLELVGRCVKYNRDERPSMKDVTQQLLQIERAELPPPSSSSSMLPVQPLPKYKLE